MMKKLILPLCLMSFNLLSYAQKDSSYHPSNDVLPIVSPDTIKIGNMLIVNDKSKTGAYEMGRGMIKINLNADARRYPNGKRVVIMEKFDHRNAGVYVKSFNDTLISVNDDTVKIGGYQIIKSQLGEGKKNWETMIENGDFNNTNITVQRKPKKLNNVSTNWFEFDLGFANWIDKTPQMAFVAMPSGQMFVNPYVTNTNLKLNNAKSSNVNIWIVQQKTNLYKHYLNLKYGFGIEMYNFRFEQPVSFGNTPGNYVYFDNVHFSKNKLYVGYLTVPIQLNLQSEPGNDKSFFASLGMSASYLLESRTKQISEERGKKKVGGNFNLNNYKLAAIGELGIGGIRLYGSYSMTNLFDKKLTYFDMAPFVIGLRLSKF
jgi:hypothetical protein